MEQCDKADELCAKHAKHSDKDRVHNRDLYDDEQRLEGGSFMQEATLQSGLYLTAQQNAAFTSTTPYCASR